MIGDQIGKCNNENIILRNINRLKDVEVIDEL